jgi:nucleoid-associated protein YgaU
MFNKKKRFDDMGEVKRDTSQIIDENIERQQEIKKSWAGRRPKTLAVSNPKPTAKTDTAEPIAVLPTKPSSIFNDDGKKGFLSAYWFPLLCAAAVVSVAIGTFWPAAKTNGSNPVPEPVVKTVEPERKAEVAAVKKPDDIAKATDRPSFDIARIENNGAIVIAGRFKPNKSISISINKKIVSTMAANGEGEFAYAPKNKLKPGNYTVQILSGEAKSDKLFVYVDEKPGQSVSLLMNANGSRVMQAPSKLADGALAVSKIDYIANKRLVVQGKALPRLRVSLSLNGRLMGMARVSDHKNFGLGAGVGELKPGEKYNLSVKLHDGRNNVVATVDHSFTMPEMTKADETFYVVRRDDCLWVIARNFLGRGIQFSIIAAENNIKNPDLIYPNQKFRIPIK